MVFGLKKPKMTAFGIFAELSVQSHFQPLGEFSLKTWIVNKTSFQWQSLIRILRICKLHNIIQIYKQYIRIVCCFFMNSICKTALRKK